MRVNDNGEFIFSRDELAVLADFASANRTETLYRIQLEVRKERATAVAMDRHALVRAQQPCSNKHNGQRVVGLHPIKKALKAATKRSQIVIPLEADASIRVLTDQSVTTIAATEEDIVAGKSSGVSFIRYEQTIPSRTHRQEPVSVIALALLQISKLASLGRLGNLKSDYLQPALHVYLPENPGDPLLCEGMHLQHSCATDWTAVIMPMLTDEAKEAARQSEESRKRSFRERLAEEKQIWKAKQKAQG